MRLPGMREGDRLVSRAESQKLIDYAMVQGINYFDSSFRYSDSEDFLGEALSKYPKASYYLATKIPGWLLKSYDSHEELFSEQLRRLRTDYIDFYLCHGVNEKFIEFYMKHQTPKYLEQLKAEGRIHYMGFSCHGTLLKSHRRNGRSDCRLCKRQRHFQSALQRIVRAHCSRRSGAYSH